MIGILLMVSGVFLGYEMKHLITGESISVKKQEMIHDIISGNEKIKEIKSLKIISNDENKLVLSYEKSKLSMDSIISEIKKQDIKIQDISTDDGDLEDVFLRLTKN